MEFVIEPPFWALFPEARIGVVVARGIDNSAAQGEAAALLARSAAQAAERIAGADIPALPAVAPWRAAYAAFGAKPSKFRSSIESLLRGALAGRLGSALWKTRKRESTRTSMLDGCTRPSSKGSMTMRPASISDLMVVSLRTTVPRVY
jgi:hypothetical protein